MANNQLSFSPYQLPSTATQIPSAYGQNYFNTLQGTLGSEMQDQANNLNQFQTQNNLLSPSESSSGMTPQLLQQVLGSPQEQINSQILPTALNASMVGQGQQYQTQLQALQFQQQLQQMAQAQAQQEEYLNLYKSLLPHGYSESFGQKLTQGLAGEAGGMADMATMGAIGSL